MNSVILGALLTGAVIGAIPAISGAVKGKMELGIGGFVCCVIGSIILGLLLSIPICAIFMYLIFKKSSVEDSNTVNTQNSSNTVSNDSPKDEITVQIRKLSELKDEGILSEDEFLEKKKQLLSKIG